MIAFPEGTTALVTDSPQRSLQKWNQILFTANGNVGDVPFPEGTEPLPGDDEHRSEVKINAIYKAVDVSGGGGSFPTTGLSAYWDMDEASGVRADASGAGLDLSEGGSATPGVAGKLNNAASFDGSTVRWLGRANPDLASGGGRLTISAWVLLNTLASDQGLVGKYNSGGAAAGYKLYFNSAAGVFAFRQANAGIPAEDQLVSAAPIVAGAWYHVVAGYDGTNHFMVINGGTRELDDGLNASDSAHAFQIGSDSDGQVCDGLIDEVGIWIGTALTNGQIATLYHGGTPLPYP